MPLNATYFQYFSAIGFPVSNQIDFERLLKLTLERGRSLPIIGGKYVVWQPGDGVELWVKIKDRGIRSCLPHFSGEGVLSILVSQLSGRTHEFTDGALRGTALADSGAYPLLLDLPDFESTAPHLAAQERVSMQVAALAREMYCFAEDRDYLAWARTNGRGNAPSLEMLEAIDALPGESLPDAALVTVTARVLKAQMRTNPATQQSFITLTAQAPGGTVDVATEPRVASGDLVVGGLIHGTFRLTGRVRESASTRDTPEPETKSSATPVLSRLTQWVRGSS